MDRWARSEARIRRLEPQIHAAEAELAAACDVPAADVVAMRAEWAERAAAVACAALTPGILPRCLGPEFTVSGAAAGVVCGLAAFALDEWLRRQGQHAAREPARTWQAEEGFRDLHVLLAALGVGAICGVLACANLSLSHQWLGFAAAAGAMTLFATGLAALVRWRRHASLVRARTDAADRKVRAQDKLAALQGELENIRPQLVRPSPLGAGTAGAVANKAEG